jgi:LemA protein
MGAIVVMMLFLAAAVFAVVLWFIVTMNRFARLKVKISESDSGIEVGLTNRFDVLTKLLDICRAFAQHETELLTGLVKLRKGMNMEERTVANNQMDELTGKINVLAEAYPTLKSSENFKGLQDSVVDVEEYLQAARRVYNMNVSSFNQLLVSFPSSIVGNIKGYTPCTFFVAEERKKSDVKMEF